MNFEEGEVLYIDKPLGWTSFDVVNKIRIALKCELGIKKIKVGHAGTLDPLATGVLIVCTGRATKRINGLMDHDKEYVATVRFGATTPSYDLETEIDKTYPTEHITKELIETVLGEKFTGEIEQYPPLFSAIKIDGKRGYQLARQGKTDAKIKAKNVKIHDIKIEKFETPEVTLCIKCSKGTYIRSIARDLGEALKSGGHLVSLRRTMVGDVTENEITSIDKTIEIIKSEKR